MAIKNNLSGYGWLAIALHWLMALAIFFLFGLGLYMVELTYYDPWYRGSLDLHKSIGMVLLILWFTRIVWRWLNTEPSPVGTPLEQKAAHWVHMLLYLLMIALMVTGYLISTADGRGIVIFELIEVPAIPFAFDNQEDVAGVIHWGLAWTLIGLVGLHAAAAIKHQLIDKDNTLARMIRPQDGS